MRGARHPIASSADSLSDRFAALTVVGSALTHEGRRVPVRLKTVSTSVSAGIVPGPTPGAECVAFIPVGEAEAEIVALERNSADQMWVGFLPSDSTNAADRVLGALEATGLNVDIAMVPEFMVTETCADELAERLAASSVSPRMVIAGSGPTRDMRDGQPWNEARILNACGTELWRQRKIWPAGLDQRRALSFGMSDPGPDGQILEDTAAGDEVVVIDADGLGRCVVLICQDIQMRSFTDDLIRMYQPDWVFVPILDTGVAEGRWMHTRTFELSALSQSRFLVASSLTLAIKAKIQDPACALAVGPKEPSGIGQTRQDVPRALAIAKTDPQVSPGIALIRWRSGLWLKTVVGSK
ncbi:hypothetical protein [Mesorhizobium sp. L2C067A000]|uniref:hypothetical protein n=1 Tax=Mesorhizobium sp. L2C067A000 TaxID=1287106 RepID=UPI0012DE5F3C|nr:hypothetical protein [Mesorhizobium sp. L2C067A000]